jgi:hypothetical protein
MKFDLNETIDGMPLIRVREFLRDRRGRNVEFTQADVASFFDLPTIPAGLLLGQMVLRGLVEPVGETFAGQTEQTPTRLMFEAQTL